MMQAIDLLIMSSLKGSQLVDELTYLPRMYITHCHCVLLGCIARGCHSTTEHAERYAMQGYFASPHLGNHNVIVLGLLLHH